MNAPPTTHRRDVRRQAGADRCATSASALRLLAALVGSVGLLGLSGLLVVGYQTQRQVSWVVQHRAEQTRRALAEVERLRRAELERLVLRVSSSIRIVAALDSAVNGGDVEEFAEQVKYELELAELREGLVRFNDAQGRPVLTLLDGTRIDDASDDDLFRQAMASPRGHGHRLPPGAGAAVPRPGASR